MPVTLNPTSEHARAVKSLKFACNVNDLVNYFYRSKRGEEHEILQSSFEKDSFPAAIRPAAIGLLTTVIKAYNNHHHLTLRPEDIWFAIINQFSAYINRHAETYRHLFVAHTGKMALEIVYRNASDRHDVDYSDFVKQMTDLMEKKIVDADLREWITPSFTTTTDDDVVIASILMMCTLQRYFDFECATACALPSVTLLGEKSDYETILRKLDRLEHNYGDEPAQFVHLLRPILSRIVRSFDDPNAADVLDFWQRIVHYDRRSGGDRISGWITAFCFWQGNGTCLYRIKPGSKILELDGVQYHVIRADDVPYGYSTVPVTIKEGSRVYKAQLTAGSIGVACSTSKKNDEEDALYEPEEPEEFEEPEEPEEPREGRDTMQPATGWWMMVL